MNNNTNLKSTLIITGTILLIGVVSIGTGVYLFNLYLEATTGYSSLYAKGKATMKAPQTIAKTFISVEVENENIEEANKKVEESLKNIVDFLMSKEFKKEDLVTNTYVDERVKEFVGEGRLPISSSETISVAVGTVELTINDIVEKENTVGEILREVLALGATSVSPLQYDVADKEAKCRELSTEALRNARLEANERMQALGGQKILRVKDVMVSDTCSNDGGRWYASPESSDVYMKQLGSEDSIAPRIPGETELTATADITVEYR